MILGAITIFILTIALVAIMSLDELQSERLGGLSGAGAGFIGSIRRRVLGLLGLIFVGSRGKMGQEGLGSQVKSMLYG
jgi:hypothetical protein